MGIFYGLSHKCHVHYVHPQMVRFQTRLSLTSTTKYFFDGMPIIKTNIKNVCYVSSKTKTHQQY